MGARSPPNDKLLLIAATKILMTRQPHDQFAKQYLAELLAPLGEVNISREVSGETRQIDVWFAPAPQPATDPQIL